MRHNVEQNAIGKAKTNGNKHFVLESLTEMDIDLIIERFELNGYINKQHFVNYFNDISERLSTIQSKLAKESGNGNGNTEFVNAKALVVATASPFRASSEWKQLKAASLTRPLEYVPMEPPLLETVHGSFQDEFASAKQLGKPLPIADDNPNVAVKKLASTLSLSKSQNALSGSVNDIGDKQDEDDLLASLQEDSEQQKQIEKQQQLKLQQQKVEEAERIERERLRLLDVQKQKEKEDNERKAQADMIAKKRQEELELRALQAQQSMKLDPQIVNSAKVDSPAAVIVAPNKADKPKLSVVNSSNRILESYSKAPKSFEDVSYY